MREDCRKRPSSRFFLVNSGNTHFVGLSKNCVKTAVVAAAAHQRRVEEQVYTIAAAAVASACEHQRVNHCREVRDQANTSKKGEQAPASAFSSTPSQVHMLSFVHTHTPASTPAGSCNLDVHGATY